MIPAEIRAVFFDAVGTLIFPHPSAPQVYAAVGQRHGSRLTVPVITERFRRAFQRQEQLDLGRDLRTSESREAERWRQIVGEVLDDVDDAEACFRELFVHFARADAWRCDPEAGPVLEQLAQCGYLLGLASNYDARLRSVAAGLPELRPVRYLVISAEVGWRKPAPEFFAALCERVGLGPRQILLVGDDWVNDYQGAQQTGLHAVLLDPAAESEAGGARIGRLRELLGE
jgi:putative hydrolase of the HAD superfamily